MQHRIKQRIQYLVEHGGLYPAEEVPEKISKETRRIRWMIAGTFTVSALNLLAEVLH